MSYKYIKYPPGLGFPTENQKSLWEAKKARDRQTQRRLREQTLAPIGQEVMRKAETVAAEQLHFGARRSADQAVTAWYVEQVVTILARPGEYRPGVGGSDDAEWGPEATKRREWERAGFPMPVVAQTRPIRRPEYEQLDPWCIGLSHQDGVHIGLTDLVHKCITQLEIPAENVIAAVIYLRRLGFHEGDHAGRQLRSLLCQVHEMHSLNVEKRVAILGLMLANKYITDEPWANKSFASVCRIPTMELTVLETVAVTEMHYSLTVSERQWFEHLDELHQAFNGQPYSAHQLVAAIVAHLRENAINMQHSVNAVAAFHRSLITAPAPVCSPIDFSTRPALDNQLEVGDVSLVSDMLDDEDDYVEYDGAKPFISKADLASSTGSPDRASAPTAAAAVSVSASAIADEEEDDFVEYDGAKPFITQADIRRNSASHQCQFESDKAVAAIAGLRLYDRVQATRRETRSREEPSKCGDEEDIDNVDAVLGNPRPKAQAQGRQFAILPVPAMQPDWSVSVDMSRDNSFASQFGFWPDQIGQREVESFGQPQIHAHAHTHAHVHDHPHANLQVGYNQEENDNALAANQLVDHVDYDHGRHSVGGTAMAAGGPGVSRWQQVSVIPARRHYHRPWNPPARIRAPCFSY